MQSKQGLEVRGENGAESSHRIVDFGAGFCCQAVQTPGDGLL